MKKKSIFTLIFSICFIIPAMFMLTACGAKEANDGGSVDGGSVEEKSVVGSWETYQVIFPAEEEGGEETVVNLGDKFTFLDVKALSKDTYNITITDKDISLTLIYGEENAVATGAGTYIENDGVYAATIVVGEGESTETFKTSTTYDKANDRLSCKIIYYESESATLYYTLILTRVNGK